MFYDIIDRKSIFTFINRLNSTVGNLHLLFSPYTICFLFNNNIFVFEMHSYSLHFSFHSRYFQFVSFVLILTLRCERILIANSEWCNWESRLAIFVIKYKYKNIYLELHFQTYCKALIKANKVWITPIYLFNLFSRDLSIYIHCEGRLLQGKRTFLHSFLFLFVDNSSIMLVNEI